MNFWRKMQIKISIQLSNMKKSSELRNSLIKSLKMHTVIQTGRTGLTGGLVIRVPCKKKKKIRGSKSFTDYFCSVLYDFCSNLWHDLFLKNLSQFQKAVLGIQMAYENEWRIISVCTKKKQNFQEEVYWCTWTLRSAHYDGQSSYNRN